MLFDFVFRDDSQLGVTIRILRLDSLEVGNDGVPIFSLDDTDSMLSNVVGQGETVLRSQVAVLDRVPRCGLTFNQPQRLC